MACMSVLESFLFDHSRISLQIIY